MHNLNVENATYMLDEVDQAVTGSLRANERSTPGETLSGEHTSELILELLVSTEEETDLASSSAGPNVSDSAINRLQKIGIPGTSVSEPMWRKSSLMKATQKRRISLSDFPLGSKSDPPFPPPMLRPVSAFLKVCSKPRNLRMERLTEG